MTIHSFLVFKKDDNKESRQVQNVTIGEAIGEADFKFQAVYAIEESAAHFSRKLCWIGKLVPSADTNTVHRHG